MYNHISPSIFHLYRKESSIWVWLLAVILPDLSSFQIPREPDDFKSLGFADIIIYTSAFHQKDPSHRSRNLIGLYLFHLSPWILSLFFLSFYLYLYSFYLFHFIFYTFIFLFITYLICLQRFISTKFISREKD